MGRTVLLLHRLPDGSSHFDWLIQKGSSGPLIAFRVAERIDRPGVAAFRAQRIPDHRAEYLDYEGPVSGDRGEVQRLAAGRAELHAAESRLTAVVDFGSGPRRWQGVPEVGGASGEGWWRFSEDGLEATGAAR